MTKTISGRFTTFRNKLHDPGVIVIHSDNNFFEAIEHHSSLPYKNGLLL